MLCKDCLPGSVAPVTGMAVCSLCTAGKFQGVRGQTACQNCTSGYLCTEGASAPQPCPGGTHADQSVLAAVGFLSNLTSDCVICPAGTSCAVGSNEPTLCLPGSIAANASQETCDLCPDGQFQRLYGQTSCQTCVPGFFCKAGSAEPTPCPAGTFGNATGLYSPGECTPVAIDFWAPLGSAVPEACPQSGFYCPGALRDQLYGGAKPIIMPVGQSTRQEDAPAVTKAMTLDISIDDFAAQREALKIQLAAQYNVDPSLITLEAAAGSVQLTITIATTDGSGNTVDLATLEQSVAAVDDTMLATTIGLVTGTTVTVVSQPLVTGTVRVTVPFACPKGKWCTAGLVVDCPLGTYNPLEDQDFATSCVLCPENSYTAAKASSSRADCVCQVGFYDANSSQVVDQDLIDNLLNANKDPITMIADAIDCHTCPVGTDCSKIGATIEALPLVPGYFRIANTTNDVRECPDARKNCSTTFGSAECKSSSGCQGGSGNQCAPGLQGTYCELCDDYGDTLVFYRKASEDGVATCVGCGDILSSMLLMAVGGVFGLVFFVIFVLFLIRFVPAQTKNRLMRFNESFTPKNKLKIVLGAYQICTKISPVYEVSLPADINQMLDDISSLVTFGIQGLGLDSTPLACLGLSGYYYKLLAYMMLPPIAIIIVLLYVLISSCRAKAKRRAKGDASAVEKKGSDDSHGGAFHLGDEDAPERGPSLFEKTLPAVLTTLFILYPMVTKVAFDGFPCYSFADGTRGWLRQDVSIDCNTPEYTTVTMTAWVAVLLYPIGIWSFCAILLLRASTTIIAGKETPLSRAIGFLYREYDVTAFWWELMEMMRKFLLVGLFSNVATGSITQIAIGTIFSATYLMVQLQAAPYKNTSDDFLAAASSFSLVMVFFCSIIYKYAALTGTEALQDKMSLEQKGDYIVSSVLLSMILFVSVLGSILFAGVLTVVQIIMEIKNNAKLRRLKYAANNKWVELTPAGGGDPQAFHLFLSHAWPAAQDRMRIVKARFLECLPSCRTFLDVDDLKSGSGTAEVDKSECILVFCTSQYFEKKNSLKELCE